VNGQRPVSVAAGSAAEVLERELVDFVRLHYPRLVRLAGLICRNVSDSEDAVQVAVEQAWRRRDTLRDPDRLKGWLDRIVVREAIRIGRRQTGLLARFFPAPREIGTSAVRTRHDEVADAVTQRETLRAAFQTLPAAQRAVVALHLYQGYTIAETAQLMGASLETTRSRLRLARERLRPQLGGNRA
jgi:RNA polymerase sigma-70 factor (ECF subfamily)